MRIAILTTDIMGRSGWSRYALDLAHALAEQGHQLLILCNEKTDAMWCEQQATLWPISHVLDSRMIRWWSRGRVKHILDTWKPNVVHAMAEPYAMLLPKQYPTFITIHGTYVLQPLATESAVKQGLLTALQHAKAIISVSQFTKRALLEKQPTLDVTVLTNAINTSNIPVRTNPQNAIKRIIGVGAVKDRKGFLEAIDACAELYKRGSVKFQYDIIGSTDQDPGYVAKLRERITAHNLSDIVTIRGSVSEEELNSAYASADLFLLLSVHRGNNVEGFGLVFLEANARGIPVIGPTTGGCPEAIDDGLSGYICKPDDARSVADRMEDVLLKNTIDPQHCRRWSEQHDVRLSAATLEEIYKNSLNAQH